MRTLMPELSILDLVRVTEQASARDALDNPPPAEEHAFGDTMLICVSRASGSGDGDVDLTIDL